METRKVLLLAGGPALPDRDPPSQEKQTHSGRHPQRDPSWCYFYHFHKAQSEGCFSQLLTQVWVIFVSKTVPESSEGDIPSGPLAGSLT